MVGTSTIEVAPSAARLTGSLRDIGYDFPTAVADLVDNSITAGASRINVYTQFEPNGSYVLISDDGSGMSERGLIEALRFGSRRQYETNVFGLMSVTRAFLPKMVERKSGRIINVSSVGGRVTLPYFGVYNSTKYAVESLSDALRYELRAFGIDVALIEPGVIRTNFEATAVSNMDQYARTAYAPAIARYEQMSKMADRFASNPIVIAKAIARAVNARRPAARYVAPRSTKT